jgi:hypothetical protein
LLFDEDFLQNVKIYNIRNGAIIEWQPIMV